MDTPGQPNAKALAQLKRLIRLAEETGLYLNLTGLGCYHKKEVPAWYDKLGETDRWKTQAHFWAAIAKVGADSPAIFCYDLMNEPILPGKKKATDWLAGEFGGKHFVQRIALDLSGRTRQQVAKAWVDKLVAAIRRQDQRHMITVGVIPWALTFPGAKPLFYAPEVGAKLDFVSVHFYPKTGEVDKALKALAVYDVGKPLVIEEMFPLKCGLPELARFVTQSAKTADGWTGFYWGRTLEEYRAEIRAHAAVAQLFSNQRPGPEAESPETIGDESLPKHRIPGHRVDGGADVPKSPIRRAAAYRVESQPGQGQAVGQARSCRRRLTAKRCYRCRRGHHHALRRTGGVGSDVRAGRGRRHP
jgi:hypothetical protein